MPTPIYTQKYPLVGSRGIIFLENVHRVTSSAGTETFSKDLSYIYLHRQLFAILHLRCVARAILTILKGLVDSN